MHLPPRRKAESWSFLSPSNMVSLIFGRESPILEPLFLIVQQQRSINLRPMLLFKWLVETLNKNIEAIWLCNGNQMYFESRDVWVPNQDHLPHLSESSFTSVGLHFPLKGEKRLNAYLSGFWCQGRLCLQIVHHVIHSRSRLHIILTAIVWWHKTTSSCISTTGTYSKKTRSIPATALCKAAQSQLFPFPASDPTLTNRLLAHPALQPPDHTLATHGTSVLYWGWLRNVWVFPS